ncbi:MAG: DUF4349 domain-containing protein, partial [Ilumatobacteraceae bacterium]|nr:DUF4349 domain-containing protein [Ilumatobacteraceae bacterium]
MARVNNVQRGSAAALILLLAVASCGSDDSTSSAPTAPGQVVTDQPAAETSPVGGDRSLSGGGEATTEPDQVGVPSVGTSTGGTPADGRLLVITMDVGLEVADVAAAVDPVVALAERHGGQLYNSDLHLADPAQAGGTLVFKLPPAEATPFITALGEGIGRRVSLTGSTDDVTSQLTDLAARIATARASVESVQALLAQAEDLGDVILLEGELTTRQTMLEQLLAQQRNLQSLVSLATVTVTLSAAPVEEVAPPAEPTHEDGIGDAFAKGWRAFLAALTAVVLFLGYTGPFLV